MAETKFKPVTPKAAVAAAMKVFDTSVFDAVNRLLAENLDPYTAKITKGEIIREMGGATSPTSIKLAAIAKMYRRAGWGVCLYGDDEEDLEEQYLEFESGVYDDDD